MTIRYEGLSADRTMRVRHLDISSEDRKTFVAGLCAAIRRNLELRKGLIGKAETCMKQYNARLERDDNPAPGDSKLDFTLTKEICIQARSRLVNPVVAQEDWFVARETDQRFRSHARTYQNVVSHVWKRREVHGLEFLNQSIDHAQIFPKAVAKVVVEHRQRKVRYWKKEPRMVPLVLEVDGEQVPMTHPETGEPVLRHAGDEWVAVEKEIVDDDVPRPKLLRYQDVVHPIPCESIDDAEYFGHGFYTSVEAVQAQIKRDPDMYRKDIHAVFGEKLEKLNTSAPEEVEDVETSQRPKTEEEKTDEHERDRPYLYEINTTYTGGEYVGQEVLVTLDLEAGVDLRIVENWWFDYPRPFAVFSWSAVHEDVDGVSLCEDLYPLHRGYTAIINQQLDGGSKSLERLVILPTGLGLEEYFDDHTLHGGVYFADEGLIEGLKKHMVDIDLVSPFTLLDGFVQLLANHAHNISSIAVAFFGHEVASRPTATGTMGVIEEAKQPLYLLLSRFRGYLQRVNHIMMGRLRQLYPGSMRVYLDSRDEKARGTIEEIFTWPEGYWGDQVIIDTRVSSQTMSREIRKQELLAMVDKLPELFRQILELATTDQIDPMLRNVAMGLLRIYIHVLKEFTAEFEIPGQEGWDEVEQDLELVAIKKEIMAQLEQQLAQLAGMPGLDSAGAPGGPGPQGGGAGGGPPEALGGLAGAAGGAL